MQVETHLLGVVEALEVGIGHGSALGRAIGLCIALRQGDLVVV